MMKTLLGLVAALALFSFSTPARAEGEAAAGGDKPADGAKKEKKAKKGKKADKAAEGAPAGDAPAPEKK